MSALRAFVEEINGRVMTLEDKPAGGGSGTVTATSGALGAGLVVVGNGGVDLKTLAAATDAFVLTQIAGVAAWAAASGGVSYGLLINTIQQPQTL